MTRYSVIDVPRSTQWLAGVWPQSSRLAASVAMFALLHTTLTIHAADNPWFHYDPADSTKEPALLEGPEKYDPDIVSLGDRLWGTWLQFEPAKGDTLQVAAYDKSTAHWGEPVVIAGPGYFSHPTLTADVSGSLWLTYETTRKLDTAWAVEVLRLNPDGTPAGTPIRLQSDGNRISHRAAAAPDGGLWLVWQEDRHGQYEIVAQQVGATGPVGRPQLVSTSPLGDWQPAIAVRPSGDLCVLWDSYDGDSFNVLSRQRIGGEWKMIHPVATGPTFQGRAQVVSNRKGEVWALWEEGAENWGRAFRSKEALWNNVRDDFGPVHRLRSLKLARVDGDGSVHELTHPLPMPSRELAEERADHREGVQHLGVFYERGLLAVDAQDRLWVTYRHFWARQAGVASELPRHHVEAGWRIYTRCLIGDQWSPLHDFEEHQRDGMQRLSITPDGNGIAALWTIGRTDRRRIEWKTRGLAFAEVEEAGASTAKPATQTGKPTPSHLTPPPHMNRVATVGGETYQLFFGDLHRHTDQSLCWPFFDGSIDDAYRYAIEVAHLDFLGITDHTRDIMLGDVLGQLWWRDTKEVTRHRLNERFYPYFAFERSSGATDHNVISLKPYVLRNFPPPLPEFWEEIDGDTFTIPHTPINRKAWDYHDDVKRPLLEIYQGSRDLDSEAMAHEGLNHGFHMGFICSSDHLSTSASFACVWSPKAGREPIFHAMKDRRTYGATDKIRLVFRSGDAWMGEIVPRAKVKDFALELDGTAPFESVEVIVDGEKVRNLEFDPGAQSLDVAFRLDGKLEKAHYVYVHLRQTDGNQAWSSPLWLD